MLPCEWFPVRQGYRRLFLRAHTGTARVIHSTYPSMSSPANPANPPARGKSEQLCTLYRHGLAVCYSTALPPGNSARLPRGVGSALAAEYGVGKDYPSRLWAEVFEQLARGQTLDLSARRSSGQTTNFTLTKRQKSWKSTWKIEH